MPTELKEIDKPFRVTTTKGVFLSGHDTQGQADSAALSANGRAENAKIETRYE